VVWLEPRNLTEVLGAARRRGDDAAELRCLGRAEEARTRPELLTTADRPAQSMFGMLRGGGEAGGGAQEGSVRLCGRPFEAARKVQAAMIGAGKRLAYLSASGW
jgi:hypothetical protein